jgi:hypothetical protein
LFALFYPTILGKFKTFIARFTVISAVSLTLPFLFIPRSVNYVFWPDILLKLEQECQNKKIQNKVLFLPLDMYYQPEFSPNIFIPNFGLFSSCPKVNIETASTYNHFKNNSVIIFSSPENQEIIDNIKNVVNSPNQALALNVFLDYIKSKQINTLIIETTETEELKKLTELLKTQLDYDQNGQLYRFDIT